MVAVDNRCVQDSHCCCCLALLAAKSVELIADRLFATMIGLGTGQASGLGPSRCWWGPGQQSKHQKICDLSLTEGMQ